MEPDNKECPHATHLIHLRCISCGLLDVVFCNEAKDWKCPKCKPTGNQWKVREDSCSTEIIKWREEFLDNVFQGRFKHISEESKVRLRSYFMSIPSDIFKDPTSSFHDCLCALVQHLERNQ